MGREIKNKDKHPIRAIIIIILVVYAVAIIKPCGFDLIEGFTLKTDTIVDDKYFFSLSYKHILNQFKPNKTYKVVSVKEAGKVIDKRVDLVFVNTKNKKNKVRVSVCKFHGALYDEFSKLKKGDKIDSDWSSLNNEKSK